MHAALLLQQAESPCSYVRRGKKSKAEARSRLACANATCRKTPSQFNITGAETNGRNRCAKEVAPSANVDLILES